MTTSGDNETSPVRLSLETLTRLGDEAPRSALFPQPQLSRSLQIALRLPLLFSRTRRELSLSDMVEAVGLTRPTAYRYATTFVRLGQWEQTADHRYRLTPAAAEPGLSVVGTMREALSLVSALEELRDDTGYTASLGVLNGTRVTYLHRAIGHRRGQHALDMELRAGEHVPLYCTALGKALLASLPALLRRRLISGIDFVPHGPRSITTHAELIAKLAELDCREPIVSDEELTVGGRSIAMYVPRQREEPQIAIDVTVPSSVYTVERLRAELGPRLVYAAKLIVQHTAEPRSG